MVVSPKSEESMELSIDDMLRISKTGLDERFLKKTQAVMEKGALIT